MPIYEFNCKECGKDSELLVRSSKWKGEKCPECGSMRLEKKLSTFAPGGHSADPMPTCTGQPSSCGRCSMN